jgi:hypothetical protein
MAIRVDQTPAGDVQFEIAYLQVFERYVAQVLRYVHSPSLQAGHNASTQ